MQNVEVTQIREKTVKVRILPKVGNYTFGNTTYFPGDILKVPEHHFRTDFMEKVEEPKPSVKPEKPIDEEKVEEEAKPTEEEPQPSKEDEAVKASTTKESTEKIATATTTRTPRVSKKGKA